MSNTFKQHMIDTYSHNELADMANHGANTGHHGLIWTVDLLNLYKAHSEALHAILAEYKDDTGEFPSYVVERLGDSEDFQGAVVYWAAEYVGFSVTEGEYIKENEEA